jgi:hypothetical protein
MPVSKMEDADRRAMLSDGKHDEECMSPRIIEAAVVDGDESDQKERNKMNEYVRKLNEE